jgi:hypothetical protein
MRFDYGPLRRPQAAASGLVLGGHAARVHTPGDPLIRNGATALPGARGKIELAMAALVAINPAYADAFVVVPMCEVA